ncbi:MAG: CoA-substrate-specific enzyme activase, partial [Deltaproteobacteria bacterium]|nr:CoA-substrate-specific enzyme activase [Deltaproteobacteria bacterium]
MFAPLSYSLGCDLGSTSVKIAVIDDNNNRIHTCYKMHKGDVLPVFYQLLDDVLARYGDQIAWAMVHGSMAQGFDAACMANEIAAVVEGTRIVFPDCCSIIDIGGESGRYITDLDAEPIRFAMNSSCSAGTGSFFEDQMTRLGTRLDCYSDYVDKAKSVPRIAGRCTVFAKTDIIHRQQEGAATEDILLGLAYAMVRNFKGTIVRNLPVREPLVLSGGVAINSGVRAAISDIFKLDTLYHSDESPCLAAIGCAALAREKGIAFDRQNFAPRSRGRQIGTLPPLPPQHPSKDLHEIHPLGLDKTVYLGIDIGSTSTNLVLVNSAGQVVDYQYLRTSGDPLAVAQQGIQEVRRRFGNNLNIAAIGTTGSGRYLVGRELNVGVIKDEITAQARGARASIPEVDTIFEIGGQDSKFIRLTNGQVSEFEMNKVCAAGTGSFVEEQAERLGISLDEFGALSLSGKEPCELGERCTVFIKSQIEKSLGEGADKASVAAGTCYSIVHNYLHKVVGNADIGQHICLSGGVAHNAGIVAAFRCYHPQLQITPYFSVTGAYGIALITRDEALEENKRSSRTISANEIQNNIQLYHGAERYFYSSYDGKQRSGKKTIGIPRALMLYKMFPMAYNFFRNLGYNVLLSPKTDEDIIRRSQELVEEEMCLPVKLILGHLSWLEEQNCDAIFMPSVYTMRHEGSHLGNNYGCVFMQNVAARFAE